MSPAVLSRFLSLVACSVLLLTAGCSGSDSTPPAEGRPGPVDISVMVFYIVGIVALGCWAGLRHQQKGGDAKDYFLAGGTLRWPIIGLALFATNISCVHLVSLAQAGYDTGLLQGNFEWMAAFTLVMLGLFFAPFYIRSRVATLPDFLEKRYCRACRDWLAILSMVSAVTIHIGFSFLTGGKVLESLFDVNMYTSIVVIAALTGLYTIIGGLMAVVVTEAIQTIVLVLGAAMITWFAWDKMGGWEPMQQVLAIKNVFGDDNTVNATVLRSAEESPGFPWYAIFLGYPVLGIWYWCADQTIVQRVLGARSEDDARIGPLFAGLIKILPVFIFVMPGMFAFTLMQSGKLDSSRMVQPGIIDVSVATALSRDLDSETVAKLTAADLYQDGQVTDVDLALEKQLLGKQEAKGLKARKMLSEFSLDEATIANLKQAGVYQSGRLLDPHKAVAQELIDISTAEKIRAQASMQGFHLDPATVEKLKRAELYDDNHVIQVDEALKQGVLDQATADMMTLLGDPVLDTKGVYGAMITQLMPKNRGLVGLMIAALLAALMSTVSGALNSISTLFSYDLYRRFKPDTTDQQLVWVGRVAAGVALALAIGLVPLLDGYPSIFEGLNDIIAHIAPPVTCVFVLGVFWPRASAMSAKLTMWIGSIMGASVYMMGKLGDRMPVAGWLNELTGGSFMMMAFYLLCVCVVMQVAFTQIWPAGESERSSKLYWESPLEPLRAKGWPGVSNYKFLAVLLIGVMCLLYYLFR